MQSIIYDKRQQMRMKNRNEFKRKILDQQRENYIIPQAMTQEEHLLKQQFSSRQALQLCQKDIDQGYYMLGLAMISNPKQTYTAQAYQRMTHYSQCQHYSWVALLILNHAIDTHYNAQAIVRDYLPILDKLLDEKNSPHTIQHGVTGIYLIHNLKSAAEQIVHMKNFQVLFHQHGVGSKQLRVQFFSIQTICECIKLLQDRIQDLRIILENGWLRFISKNLGFNRKQKQLLESLKNLAKNQVFVDQIMENSGLLVALMAKQTMGTGSVLEKVYEIWRQLAKSQKVHHLFKLIDLRVTNMLIEGLSTYANVGQGGMLCLQTLEVMLEKIGSCSTAQPHYETFLKSLLTHRFPKILLIICTNNPLYLDICQRVLLRHFNHLPLQQL